MFGQERHPYWGWQRGHLEMVPKQGGTVHKGSNGRKVSIYLRSHQETDRVVGSQTGFYSRKPSGVIAGTGISRLPPACQEYSVTGEL